tara:strand:+ start:130 stop:708 length:579 start_codon:yes stop_codon:yes gene_type:complete
MSLATFKKKSRHTSPKYPISAGHFSIIGGYRNRGGVGRVQMIGSDNYVSFNDASVIKPAVVSSSSRRVLHPCCCYKAKEGEVVPSCTGYPHEVVQSYIIAGDPFSTKKNAIGFSANNTDSSTLITAKKLMNSSCVTRANGSDTHNQCENTTKTTQDTPVSYEQYLGADVSKKIPICGGSNLPFPYWVNNNCN